MTTDLAVVEHDNAPAPVTLFRTEQPAEVVARASETAKALAEVVKKQKLTTSIQGRDHVRVEGWTLLGTMLGVFPFLEWSRKCEDGWEARVVAQTMSGAVVGAAEAQCLRSERLWASRDDYALRSMAQTRATSKALRQPLGFVMTLAGFDPTPLEEMPQDADFAPVQEAKFQAPSEKPATDKQAKMVDDLIDKVTKAGLADAVELTERLQKKYGTSLAIEMTASQATECITGLQKILGEAA